MEEFQPHKLHQLVILKYFGSEGNNASSFSRVKDGLGIGKGSILNSIEHTITALFTTEKRSIFWPSSAEEKEFIRII
jgi:hypothetical protein